MIAITDYVICTSEIQDVAPKLPPANKYSLHLDRSDSYSPPLIPFPGKSSLGLAVPPTTTTAHHGNTVRVLSRHALRIGFVDLTRTDECVSATDG